MSYRRDESYEPSGYGVVTREAILDYLRGFGDTLRGQGVVFNQTNRQIRKALGWDGWNASSAVSEELRSLYRSGLVQRHGTKTRPSYSAVLKGGE